MKTIYLFKNTKNFGSFRNIGMYFHIYLVRNTVLSRNSLDVYSRFFPVYYGLAVDR